MIKKLLTSGTFWLVVAGFATAIGTLVLAYMSYENIKLTEDIYTRDNRPWINIYLLKSQVDEANQKTYVTLQLKAMGKSPAKFIQCFRWSTPGYTGGQGAGISFPTSVLLPGEAMDNNNDIIIFLEGESFESVFKYGREARLEIMCHYGMKGNEFRTKKVFILNKKPYGDAEYHEAPQSAELN